MSSSTGAPDRYRAALAVTILLFALWGMAHNLNDVLVSQFRRAFDLGDLGSSLVQASFYFAYLVMPIPVALFMQRFGFRRAVITGLLLYASGCFAFYPAALTLAYGAFLVALFVVASGLTFIETAGFGLMLVTSPPEKADFRLQLASAFNPMGSILGIVVGARFIFSGEEASPAARAAMSAGELAAYRAHEAQAVQGPYLVIGGVLLIVALAVAVIRFPASADERQHGMPFAGLGVLLRRPMFMGGVAAQFFYVGTQVGIWSFIIRYAQVAMPGIISRQAAVYLTASLVALLVGRFASLTLLKRYSSAQVGVVYAGIGALLTLVAILFPGPAGVYALVAVSFFMSVMYPAIFAIALTGNLEHAKPASALITMSIVGGGVLTATMGAISDASGRIATGYVVPLAGFFVVGVYCTIAVKRGLCGGEMSIH